MANSEVAQGNTPELFDDKFFVEHVQQNRFASTMGKDENSIIQIKEDLTKERGDTITYTLINRLTGDGVEDGATLEGNEEDQDDRSFKLTIKERANAVARTSWVKQKASFDVRQAARIGLKTWAMENTRDRIITAYGSINGVAYGTATEVQKDAWLVDNADRVLFGALVGNNASNDHSAALAQIDNTADKLSTGAASLMKRIARTASPKIRPVMSSNADNRFFYVMYVPSLVFRDLQADTTITTAQRTVHLRMQNEKLFKGGDLEWDGIIFKETEDIEVLTGVGAGSIDVAPVYLAGAQAVGYGIASRWKSTEETFDYGRRKGVAIAEMGGFEKMLFGSGASDTTDLKDHGLVTGFFASVADS